MTQWMPEFDRPCVRQGMRFRYMNRTIRARAWRILGCLMLRMAWTRSSPPICEQGIAMESRVKTRLTRIVYFAGIHVTMEVVGLLFTPLSIAQRVTTRRDFRHYAQLVDIRQHRLQAQETQRIITPRFSSLQIYRCSVILRGL